MSRGTRTEASCPAVRRRRASKSRSYDALQRQRTSTPTLHADRPPSSTRSFATLRTVESMGRSFT